MMNHQGSRRVFDLEQRLVDYVDLVLRFIEASTYSETKQVLLNQLARSATSVALNYAEAMEAESNRDFIHKLKLSTKELRESHICIQILAKRPNVDVHACASIERETKELLLILSKSIRTTKQRLKDRD